MTKYCINCKYHSTDLTQLGRIKRVCKSPKVSRNRDVVTGKKIFVTCITARMDNQRCGTFPKHFQKK